MSRLRCHISISLDGFVAGPNQSEENPLGEGGEQLHDWVVRLAAWRQSHGEEGGEVNENTDTRGIGREPRRWGDGPEYVRPCRRWCLGRRAVDGLVGRQPA